MTSTLRLLAAGIRIVLATIAICVAGYTAVILGVAQLVTPDTANGSLIATSDGVVVGSRLIAQQFTDPRYFWPRPSAADFNAAGAAGSNKSPTSPELTERARELIAHYGATPENPVPPELVAASGGGLDPHISAHAALYQAERVARARQIPRSAVDSLIGARAFAPGGRLMPGRLVNVLELNLALDSLVTLGRQ